jgi:hypothetical protein
MRCLNTRAPRIAGLLALALGAVALLALSGVATAKDRHGDDHGHHHHHHQFEMGEAGTISSFDATTGKLTITLINGEMVTGLVTENTRIKCEGFDDNRLDRRDHDNGGRGDEPGDDNGGSSGPGSNGSSGSGSTPGGPGPSNEGGRPVGGEGPEEGEGPECTTASLVPGEFVSDAELRLEGGGAVFTEVELGHDS